MLTTYSTHCLAMGDPRNPTFRYTSGWVRWAIDCRWAGGSGWTRVEFTPMALGAIVAGKRDSGARDHGERGGAIVEGLDLRAKGGGMDDAGQDRWVEFTHALYGMSSRHIPGPCDSTPLAAGGQVYAVWQSCGVLRVGL